MDKVYIVTNGAYSSYHIVAAFPTRDEAEQFASGAAEVEEWVLGIPEDGRYQQTYTAYLHVKSGNEINIEGWYKRYVQVEQHPDGWSRGSTFEPSSIGKPFKVASGSSVVSFEHALKIAGEARQAYIRENGLPTQDLEIDKIAAIQKRPVAGHDPDPNPACICEFEAGSAMEGHACPVHGIVVGAV